MNDNPGPAPAGIPRRDFLKVTGAWAGGLAAAGWTATASHAAAAIGHPASPAPGEAAYRWWQESAKGLLLPLAALMKPGICTIPIIGQSSEYGGPQADRLESFVRPLLLAAHWLQSKRRPEDEALRQKVSTWFREGLLIGTDPGSVQYFGPDANYQQQHVEIGLLCIGLQLAPQDLWQPFSTRERDQIVQWLGSARGSGIVNNNHYFMAIHILEFLDAQGYGRRADRPVVDEFLNRLEFMHRGGGWFEDGINQAYDHYNAFAFHFYGLMWSRLFGARDTARRDRWHHWARTFVQDYQHFFSAGGEHPAFGRSITYRFNTINVFGMALAEGCCDLAPGMLRRLCTRNLDFFLSRPIYQSQGCLSVGWTDEFPGISERYSCAASPYWAAKGLSPLLLPEDHAFWHAAEEPLPSERGDHARVIKPAGLVVRSVGGAVEILNAGSQISNLNLRYGAWKWSKTAYRSGVGFTVAYPNDTNWSWDDALTIETDDGATFGRHSTVAVEMDENHLYYSANLGGTFKQINVGLETGVWWNAGWLLQVHTYNALQPVVLRLGGYALPSAAPTVQCEQKEGVWSAWSDDGRGSLLQPLHGFTGGEWDNRLDRGRPRAHLASPYHATPVAVVARTKGPGWLAALAWAGSDRAESAPWSVTSGAAGHWQLEHPKLGRWDLTHWALPALATA